MRTKDNKKKQAIIKHTLDLVMKEGIAGINMAKLAKRVKISPGTFYLYYKNKEDLIISIYSEFFEDSVTVAKEIMQRELPYRERIKKVWTYWITFNIENHKALNFYLQVRQSPYVHKLPPKTIEGLEDLGETMFQEGIQKEVIKNVSTTFLTSVIGSSVQQAASLILNKQAAMEGEDIEILFSFLWDAIKK